MTRHPSSEDWSEDTRPDIVTFPSASLKAAAPASTRVPSEAPASADPEHRIGQLMAALAKNDRVIGEHARKFGTLEREVGQLRRDIEQDREELVRGASKKAATHSSNRVAGIMTGAFAAWEILSPYVHDLLPYLRELMKGHS